MQRKTPFRSTPSILSNSSSSISSLGFATPWMPALLTSTSIFPKLRFDAGECGRYLFLLAHVAVPVRGRAAAFPGFLARPPVAWLVGDVHDGHSATLLCEHEQAAFPMPVAPPVTITTLPSTLPIRLMTSLSSLF